MGLFKKKTEKKSYDPDRQKPVIHCSICNGEEVAGFKKICRRRTETVCCSFP